MAELPLFPTSLVGSLPQPDWLIDRPKLAGRFPPRVRARELWRPAPEFLAEAQDDATVLAIRSQEEAGLDIITDGEIRRESYSNHFATALVGLDLDNPGEALDRSGHPNPVPRVVGPVHRPRPVQVDDVRFLRAHTDRIIKVTVPGPFTMSQQAQDDYYGDPAVLAVRVRRRGQRRGPRPVRGRCRHRPAGRAVPAGAPGAGPALRIARAEPGSRTASAAPPRCTCASAMRRSSTTGRPAIRSCPSSPTAPADQISIETGQSNLDPSVLATLAGKTIILGVIDLSDPAVESGELVADRVRRALPFVAPEKIVMATDCGMKYLPRGSADGKMRAMAAAARMLRSEFA